MGVEEAFAYQSFRSGQRELAVRVQEACLNGELLLAEAMSGLGKTAAVLAGVVPVSEKYDLKIVYACRTKRQILRVVEELSLLQKKHPLPAASMLSKYDYCLLKEGYQRSMPQSSFGWFCWFNVHNNLCSYFLNVSLLGGEFEDLVRTTLMDVPPHQTLLERSRLAHVCPYEVERMAVAQARIAVVPYHYVFDPSSAPALFSRNQIDKGRTILVVDEAHNLRDFMRGINTATITLEQLDGAILEAKGLLMDLTALSLQELKEVLTRAVQETPRWRIDRSFVLEEFRRSRGSAWLQNLAFELVSCSEVAWGAVAYDRRLPSLLLKVGEFLVRLVSSSRAVLVKWERTLALIDPDPVGELASVLHAFRSSILVSATMNPSAVFSRSLGLSPAEAVSYAVPTEPLVRVRTVIDTGSTTRYKARSPQMYATISEKIGSVVRATNSGVGIFTPSYSVLEPIFEMASRRIRGRNLMAESRGMSSREATEVFESLRTHEGSVLFAVQGGRFSEGEDFRENLMGAVIVVGLSLPPPTPMLYAEYACLKHKGEPDSYLMLSRLPALRKAFQAAGRHVRNPGKRGLVFLVDRRFDSEVVMDLMPSWMKRDVRRGDFTPEQIERVTEDFWRSE